MPRSSHTRWLQTRLSLRVVASTALLATACAGSSPTESSDSPDQPDTPAVATLEITGPVSLIVPQSAPFEVMARDSDGDVLAVPDDLIWYSSNTAVATVSRDGVVSAVKSGEVTIGVRSGAIRGEIAVSVAFPPAASLRIASATSLIVHEMALFEVTARSADGYEFPVTDELNWDTSDGAVATVSEDGVVSAHERGNATIGVSVGDIRAETALSVKARVRITPTYWYRGCGSCTPPQRLGSRWLRLGVGDTLSLSASYVDVDGALLEEGAIATWESDNPDAVSVSSEGRIVALLPGNDAHITASAADGTDVAAVQVVGDVIAGLPATLRLAHAASGVGPVTFVHNKGAPVTLEFGESLDIPITSGVFMLEAEGLPPGNSSYGLVHKFEAVNGEGAHLAIYAVGGSGSCCGDGPVPVAGLVGTWDPSVDVPVPDDSVRVRVIQGSTSALVVFLLPRDAPIPPYGTPSAVLVSCYFDPGNVVGYWTLPTRNRDFVLQDKARSRSVRIPATLQAGRSMTYVLTQDDHDEWGIAAFPDP